MGPIIIIFAIVIGVFIFLYVVGSMSGQSQSADAATIEWDVMMSPEIQENLAENKIVAIKHYREMTGVGLKEAKDAVEYAMAHPEHHTSGSSSKPRPRAKLAEGEMDWDVLLSAEMTQYLPNKKIEAIKLYRERTGVGLKEAKDAVEYFIDHPGEVPAKIRRYDLAEDQAGGIRDLLREGKRAEAQKIYQAFTGVDQFTASEAIDALQEEMRREQDGI
jgi:ribosomal protein L7/L12